MTGPEITCGKGRWSSNVCKAEEVCSEVKGGEYWVCASTITTSGLEVEVLGREVVRIGENEVCVLMDRTEG